MHYKLKTAAKILKQRGLKSLIKTSLKKAIETSYYPYCLLKVRGSSLRTVDKAVKFVFEGSGGLLSAGQVRSEISSLLTLLNKRKPKYMLEIGTASGGSLFLFSRIIAPDATITSIDLPGGNYGAGYSKFKVPLYKSFALRPKIIHLLRLDSHNEKTLKEVKKILGNNKLDFLFIDGDHTYEGVKKDFEMYAPLVGENGIIALHDILQHKTDKTCEVHLFWKELKKKYNCTEFIEDPKQGWAGIGVVKK